jgi:hypothetical protein
VRSTPINLQVGNNGFGAANTSLAYSLKSTKLFLEPSGFLLSNETRWVAMRLQLPGLDLATLS